MQEIIHNIIDAFWAQSPLEMIAVFCAIMYLILVVRENIWCWPFAFTSTTIYIYLFFKVALLSESILNVYYLFMAIYGWWQWSEQKQKTAINIQRWRLKTHLCIIVGTVILTPIVGHMMSRLGASFPYLDAFVAILAVIATLMVVYKVFENWYYWLVIDTLSIYLFWQKELYLTAGLFLIYIVLIFYGIQNWKKLMSQQR